ncbi:hypothetical protein DRJ19_02600 [Candidatus Woesearchaeota archaeon]|nr:MAG: hypothetical protein DRJ19_02600 [Candidatus Woesearchaeota archaeon]
MKRIITKGKFGGAEEIIEIDYSKMSSAEVLSRIKQYEKKYGTYEEFCERIDCGYSPMEDLDAQEDWELLIEERRRRVLEGRIKIVLNSKPITFRELIRTINNRQKSLPEILEELEKKRLIKKYIP